MSKAVSGSHSEQKANCLMARYAAEPSWLDSVNLISLMLELFDCQMMKLLIAEHPVWWFSYGCFIVFITAHCRVNHDNLYILHLDNDFTIL